MTIKEAVGVTSSDLLKWLLGIIATVLMLLAGTSMAENRQRIDRIEQRVQSTEKTTIELDAHYDDIMRQLGHLNQQLDQVDTKIDRVLEVGR